MTFHEAEDPDLDPVTYEVIRHRLWTINIGHGEMVTRVSGSPIFQLGDFNMCVLTEDGEVVMNAPYVAFLDSGAPLAIAYILEHLSDDPGIADGDVFACNDPWIGAVHQMDVFLGMPVFVEGKLFAWVSNAGHQYDLGGVAPGGWPENAVDVYQDPVVMPPFKLVEKGHLRKDLEALYLRHSRFPDRVVLDLRAQLAGCRFAAEQLRVAAAEFGADTLKAAMRRVLSTAQASFAASSGASPMGSGRRSSTSTRSSQAIATSSGSSSMWRKSETASRWTTTELNPKRRDPMASPTWDCRGRCSALSLWSCSKTSSSPWAGRRGRWTSSPSRDCSPASIIRPR